MTRLKSRERNGDDPESTPPVCCTSECDYDLLQGLEIVHLVERTQFQALEDCGKRLHAGFVPCSLRPTEPSFGRLHVSQHLLLRRCIPNVSGVPHSRDALQEPAIHTFPQHPLHLLNLGG